MTSGLALRMNSVCRKTNGRSVIIAMDHGSIAGPMPGIEKPGHIISACADAGVDGILTTKGFVDASRDAWDRGTGLVLRMTGGFTVLDGKFEEEMIMTAETAVAYGAVCGAVTVKFGHEREGHFIRQASLAIDACHRYGLPVMVEAMARGTMRGSEFPPNDPTGIALASRAAAELGADIIKTYYTGSPESFRKVTEGCPVPVVVLGGAKTDNVRQVFQDIYDSLQGGGKGIAVGRNIWQYENLPGMLEAVMGLVHEDWSVDQACEAIGEP